MSAEQTTIGELLGRRSDGEGTSRNAALALLEKYSPRQGWATLAFLLLTILIVADSINAAEWVDMDGMTAIMIWSALRGHGARQSAGALVRAHPRPAS